MAKLHVPVVGYTSLLLVEGLYFGGWDAAYPSVKPYLDDNAKKCSVSNWTAVSYWENIAEGFAGCELLSTGRCVVVRHQPGWPGPLLSMSCRARRDPNEQQHRLPMTMSRLWKP